MKTLNITNTQRLQSVVILNQQTGNAGELRPVLGLLKKLDLSEDERSALHIREFPGGLVKWDEEPGKLSTTVKLEDAEASKLRQVLSDWPHLRPSDLDWLEPLLGQL